VSVKNGGSLLKGRPESAGKTVSHPSKKIPQTVSSVSSAITKRPATVKTVNSDTTNRPATVGTVNSDATDRPATVGIVSSDSANKSFSKPSSCSSAGVRRMTRSATQPISVKNGGRKSANLSKGQKVKFLDVPNDGKGDIMMEHSDVKIISAEEIVGICFTYKFDITLPLFIHLHTPN